jgi:membrane protein YqaA with SNARE-associated domain
MSPLVALLVAYLVTVLINLIPAFMPPSWSVLAFFLIKFGLPLLLVTIGGAVASSIGRLGLTWMSRHWGRRFLSRQRRGRLRTLGHWLDAKPPWLIGLAVFLFAVGPIPSNAVFIAAGLTEISLVPVLAGFFLGRCVSYTALDLLSKKAAHDFTAIFLGTFRNPLGIAIDVLAVVVVGALAFVDWPQLLHIPGLEESSE